VCHIDREGGQGSPAHNGEKKMKIKIGHFGAPYDTHGARYYLHIDPASRSVSSFSSVGDEVPAEALHGLTVLVPIGLDLHIPSLVEVLKGDWAQVLLGRIVNLYEGRSEGTWETGTEGTTVGRWRPGWLDILKLKEHIDRRVPLQKHIEE
jgi:hypothetical protein